MIDLGILPMSHAQYADWAKDSLDDDEAFRSKALAWFCNRNLVQSKRLVLVVKFRPLLDSPLPRA